jgi:hypothetical protein
MKTFGQILIVLTVFAIVMGITYVAVSAGNSSTSANPPAFEQSGENFRPPNGERPEFDGAQGGGWAMGLAKNISIIAIIVTLISLPKHFVRRKTVPIRVK